MSYSRGRTKRQNKKRGTQKNLFQSLGFNTIEEFNQKNKSEMKKKKSSNEIEIKDDEITGIYDENLNIRKLHSIIVEKLEKIDEAEIRAIEEEKDKLTEKLEEEVDNLSYIEVIEIAEKIENYNKRIHDINNNEILNNYLKSVSSIIEKFDKIVSEEDQNTEDSEHLARIVDNFIKITNFEFFNISLQKKQNKKKDECDICGESLSGISEDEGYRSCPTCGKIQKEIMNFYKNEAKSDYDNSHQESTENVKNFRKAIHNFDHRADTSHLPPNSEIVYKLDEYFETYNPKLHRNYIHDNGFDRWIRKGTNIYDMEEAMKEKKFNKYYDNIYHFCKIYWGWKRPGISHLEETLIEDFRKSRASYNIHKGSRNSSMNVNYELYHGLKRHGFNCKFSDFKMIKTKSTLDEYDEIRKKVEADMGWGVQK